MTNSRIAAQSRQSLDARFALAPALATVARPAHGWIKAIREALGMSSAQLAKRLKIKQPTLAAIEQSERRDTIQLATLRRVAAAMNCTLVYALVPNEPLDAMVHAQARKAATRQLRSIAHSMTLEDQAVPATDFEARLDALARDINPRKLWDEA